MRIRDDFSCPFCNASLILPKSIRGKADGIVTIKTRGVTRQYKLSVPFTGNFFYRRRSANLELKREASVRNILVAIGKDYGPEGLERMNEAFPLDARLNVKIVWNEGSQLIRCAKCSKVL